MRITDSLRIGIYVKTRVRIHYTWLLVFLLIPWSVSTQFSTETDLVNRVLLGVITAVLFFFGIFLREILLLMIANLKGIHVQILTIFAFGGLVQTDPDTETPSLEMLLALSGALLNFVITILFYFAALFVGNSQNNYLMDIPLKWLSFFFFTLSLFHFLPAYPLEGGRMLHVLFRKLTGNLRRALRISGISGWVLGFGTMAGGAVLAVYTSELFSGLFFIGLGLIIQNAATHAIRSIKELSLYEEKVFEDQIEESPLPPLRPPPETIIPESEAAQILSDEIYTTETEAEEFEPPIPEALGEEEFLIDSPDVDEEEAERRTDPESF